MPPSKDLVIINQHNTLEFSIFQEKLYCLQRTCRQYLSKKNHLAEQSQMSKLSTKTMLYKGIVIR